MESPEFVFKTAIFHPTYRTTEPLTAGTYVRRSSKIHTQKLPINGHTAPSKGVEAGCLKPNHYPEIGEYNQDQNSTENKKGEKKNQVEK